MTLFLPNKQCYDLFANGLARPARQTYFTGQRLFAVPLQFVAFKSIMFSRILSRIPIASIVFFTPLSVLVCLIFPLVSSVPNPYCWQFDQRFSRLCLTIECFRLLFPRFHLVLPALAPLIPVSTFPCQTCGLIPRAARASSSGREKRTLFVRASFSLLVNSKETRRLLRPSLRLPRRKWAQVDIYVLLLWQRKT